MNIDRENSNFIGLFASIGTSGTVKNLKIESPTIKLNSQGGGLAGENHGVITKVGVENGSIEGYAHIGGLVGENSETITKSYSSNATIKGNQYIGGIVSWNKTDATIEDSYSTGAIIVSNGKYIGGFSGGAQGSTVRNCYAAVTISDHNGTAIGHFFGGIYVNDDNTSCYFQKEGRLASIGSLHGGYNPQGIIGYTENSSGNIQNNNPAGAEEITDVDFSGWDFNTDGTWEMTVGQWPTLQWQSQ